MVHARMEDNRQVETPEEEKEEDNNTGTKEDFRPLGLMEIYELYLQRQRPPLDLYDNVYHPYREKERHFPYDDE